MSITCLAGCAAVLLNVSVTHDHSLSEKTMHRFDFGAKPARPGWVSVTADAPYTDVRGYGWLEGVPGGTQPYTFAVAVPEGNYDVILTLGGGESASETTVRAESRRLLAASVATKPGEAVTLPFTVNVRTPRLACGGRVGLKCVEKDKRDWDNKLSLTFGGKHPAVSAIEIRPAPNAVTVYLAGDSTVTDQEHEPWSAWGQMLPAFFVPGVAVANHAQSGESLSSFSGERRWEKILDTLRAGDYVFIQFAHNDQKAGPTHADPYTTYTARLKAYLDAVRERKATPVLVTSMHRRRFDESGRIVNTLGEYPQAMRQLAAAEKVALIDLHAMSQPLFESMGAEGSKHAFVHYPADTFPGQKEPLKDDTHFSDFGGYALARCVVEGIRKSVPALAKHLRPGTPAFDPTKPADCSPFAPTMAKKKDFQP